MQGENNFKNKLHWFWEENTPIKIFCWQRCMLMEQVTVPVFISANKITNQQFSHQVVCFFCFLHGRYKKITWSVDPHASIANRCWLFRWNVIFFLNFNDVHNTEFNFCLNFVWIYLIFYSDRNSIFEWRKFFFFFTFLYIKFCPSVWCNFGWKDYFVNFAQPTIIVFANMLTTRYL